MADQAAQISTAAMGVGTALEVAPVSLRAVPAAMGAGASALGPDAPLGLTASSRIAGLRTVADLPASVLSMQAAAQAEGARLAASVDPQVRVDGRSRGPGARLVAALDPSRVRAVSAGSGPGTSGAAPVPGILAGSSLPAPAAHAAHADPKVETRAATQAEGARLIAALGYGTIDRCTVTVKDTLVATITIT
jgi:hypothetical protein